MERISFSPEQEEIVSKAVIEIARRGWDEVLFTYRLSNFFNFQAILLLENSREDPLTIEKSRKLKGIADEIFEIARRADFLFNTLSSDSSSRLLIDKKDPGV